MTWTLHHGDCLDPVTGLASLPDKSVDHVICDPPYSEHVHSAQRRGHPTSGVRDADLGFEFLSDRVRYGVACETARLASRWALVFCDMESAHLWIHALTSAGLRYVRTCLWRRTDGMPQFTGDRPAVACEAVVTCHADGAMRWNGGGKHGFYEFGIERENRQHTTQKPLTLMESLAADFTDPGETILDPFAGSGTTGVAAIRLGRNFIGFEKNERYYEIARKRLEGAREQLTLPVAPKRKAKQETLLP